MITLWILGALVWIGINIANDRAAENHGYSKTGFLLDVMIWLWLASLVVAFIS